MTGSPNDDILRFFDSSHLSRLELKEIMKLCENLALEMDAMLPTCAETRAGLRKLLEAKDCFVRAAV